MKNIPSLLIISIFGTFAACSGQVINEKAVVPDTRQEAKSDTTKQMNLLDEQTKILGSVFGKLDTEGENPFVGTTNYLELIDKMEGPEVDKEYLREQYQLYDLSLDPKKKEEFKLLFNKKLKEAMDQGLIKQ
tara:strand:- start:1182 stop:1577 length:396 start_codon:yes stop_codon:yes gene_type:complete